MKRIILFITILLASASVAMAQGVNPLTTPVGTNDDVTLNVKLNPIQTLVVNPAQENVILDYTTITDYDQGVQSLQKDHLKIYSTGAFHVQVASAANQITRTNGTEFIEANTLKVTSSLGSTNSLAGATVGEVELSTTATDIISSEIGGADRNFNVTYGGLGGNGFVNKYYNTENPTVYTTTVTYSIAAK